MRAENVRFHTNRHDTDLISSGIKNNEHYMFAFTRAEKSVSYQCLRRNVVYSIAPACVGAGSASECQLLPVVVRCAKWLNLSMML